MDIDEKKLNKELMNLARGFMKHLFEKSDVNVQAIPEVMNAAIKNLLTDKESIDAYKAIVKIFEDSDSETIVNVLRCVVLKLLKPLDALDLTECVAKDSQASVKYMVAQKIKENKQKEPEYESEDIEKTISKAFRDVFGIADQN